MAKYGENIRTGYSRLHCPDQRTFEADADGFVTTCRCGSVRRPWSELSRYSENDRFFLLGTKNDTQVVPKSAFDSPGTVTELRQVVLEKISIDRPFATPPIEFAYVKEDFRHARMLHIREGGGWQAWVRPVFVLAFCSFGLAGIWSSGEPKQDSLYWTGIVGLVAGMVFLRAIGARRTTSALCGCISATTACIFKIPPRKAARAGISSSVTSRTARCFCSTTTLSSIESFLSVSSATGDKNFALSSKPSFLVSSTANHFPQVRLSHRANRAPRPNICKHDDALIVVGWLFVAKGMPTPNLSPEWRLARFFLSLAERGRESQSKDLSSLFSWFTSEQEHFSLEYQTAKVKNVLVIVGGSTGKISSVARVRFRESLRTSTHSILEARHQRQSHLSKML